MFGRDPIDLRFAHYCRTGDPDALGDVFDHTAGRLMRVALWLALDRVDAEDLLQRAFLQAIETRTQFEPGKPVLPWLMGLLGNQARKLRRDRDRVMALRPPPDRVRDPEVEASARELEQTVGAVSDRLGEPYRDVLRLHLEQGLDAKEIAERLERPAGTVRTQLVRALDLLRRRLPGGFVAGLGALTIVDVAAVAAVRTAVMTSAHAAAVVVTMGTAATTTVTLGALLMAKKVLLVLPVALLLAAVTWVTVWRGSGDEALPPGPVVSRVDGSAGRDSNRAAAGAAQEVATERIATTSLETSGEPGFAALRVVVRWQRDGSPVSGMGVQARRSSGGVLHQREGITDTDGIAVLAHIAPGTYFVEGSLIDHDEPIDLAAGELRTVEVTASQKTFVAGRVIDSDGRPVAGARLWLSASMNWSEGWEAARSDVSGSFTVPLVSHQYVGAQMEGHVPSYLQSWDASRGPFRDIVLQLRGISARLHGTVRDVRGKPVSWATVRIGANGGGAVASGTPSVRFTMPNPEKLTTDEHGRFTATGLPPGDVPLWVWAPGFGLLRQSVAVAAGTVETIDFTLLDAAVVTGVVLDPAGQPVPKAGIRFGDEFGTFPQAHAQTDEVGRFRLDNLPAWPEGVVLVAGRGTIKATARLQLTSGTTTEWNPVLDNGRTIRGTVLGPDDRPLTGMKVGVVHPSYQSVQRWFETGAGGAFELQQVGDKPCDVQVAQGETVLLEVRAVAPDTRDLVVRVRARDLPTARVRGRVLDASGRPVQGLVHLRRDSVMNYVRCTLDAATGAFTFGPMAASQYRIMVITGEGSMVLLGSIELEPSEERVLDDFILQPTGDLEFTVLDAAGQPVDTTNVHLRTEAGDTLGAGILARGKGKATNLQPGRYLVEVHFDKRHAAEVMTAEVEVRSGATTPVEIRGRAGVQVKIAFRDLAPADPERSVLVCCRGEDGRLAGILATYPQNQEPLVLRNRLAPGRYQLDCKVSDGRRVAAELAIGSLDEKPTITIDLPAR